MAGSCFVALREKYRSSMMPSLTTVHGWHGSMGGKWIGGADGKKRLACVGFLFVCFFPIGGAGRGQHSKFKIRRGKGGGGGGNEEKKRREKRKTGKKCVRKSFRQHWTLLFPGQNPRSHFPPLHDTRVLSKQAPPFRHDLCTQHLMFDGSWGQAPVTKNPINCLIYVFVVTLFLLYFCFFFFRERER